MIGGVSKLKPVNIGGHAAYQNRVLAQLRKYYPDAVHSLPAPTWEIMEKFWNLDLSEIDIIMQDRYSDFGPEPRLPSDMLRSILLSVEFKVTSYTKWAADLKENHLHAILSGFTIGDTPGTGTFYDFQSRLWLSDDDNLSPKVHPPKEKPQKPKKKGEKAPPVEKYTVKELFEKFEREPPQDMKPCLRLFQIFKELFLLKSDRDGLIDLMDDILVNFDEKRVRNTTEVLKLMVQETQGMQNTQQILFYTCHERTAQILQNSIPNTKIYHVRNKKIYETA